MWTALDDQIRCVRDGRARVARRTAGRMPVPLGAWARVEGGRMVLDACVLSADGAESICGARQELRLRSGCGESGTSGSGRTCSRPAPIGCCEWREDRWTSLRNHRAVKRKRANPRREANRGDARAGAGARNGRRAGKYWRGSAADADGEFCAAGRFQRAGCRAEKLAEFDWILFTSQNAVRFSSSALVS